MLLNLKIESNEELVNLAEVIAKQYMKTHSIAVSEGNVYRVVIRVLHGNIELSYKGIRDYIKDQWNDKVNINVVKLYSCICDELVERKLISGYNEFNNDEMKSKIKEICFTKMTRKGYEAFVKTLDETRDENIEAIFDFVIRMAENFEEE